MKGVTRDDERQSVERQAKHLMGDVPRGKVGMFLFQSTPVKGVTEANMAESLLTTQYSHP